MKLPRWLVIAMLTTSILSVLAAAGWWWVMWPERTGRELEFLWRTRHPFHAERTPRSLLDVIVGREVIKLVYDDTGDTVELSVQRGKIIRHWENGFTDELFP